LADTEPPNPPSADASRAALPGEADPNTESVGEGSPEGPVRVVVADDHPVVREGLRSFLASRPGMVVVGEAADADEVVRVAEELRPDVVLVDLMMPGRDVHDGIEAIHRMRQLPSSPRALVLTSFAGDDKVLPALRAGAAGYLLKDVDPADLEAAIRTVHQGGALLAPSVANRVLDQATGAQSAPADAENDRLRSLTPRELEVLELLGRGLPNRRIAAELYVSEKTVKTHVSSILSKLRVADRTQAALFAVRHGLAEPAS
jgi:NarL family two-component system response regulator LiaR